MALQSTLLSTPDTLQIPLEIVELILDCLQYDKETLLSCSLVSTRWVHRCRSHLFRRIGNFTTFLKLMKSPHLASPTISPSTIRDVVLLRNPHSLVELQQFDRLSRLYLAHLDFPPLYLANCKFPNVTALGLVSVSAESPQRLAAALSNFPSLRSLTVLGVRWLSDNSPGSRNWVFPQSWESLTLDELATPFLRVLVANGCPRLRCIHGHRCDLQEIYSQLGPSLECTSLTTAPSNLSPNSRLRHIFIDDCDLHPTRNMLHMMTMRLSEIETPSELLEAISFQFTVSHGYTPSKWQILKWSLLEKVLLSPTYRNLKVIRLHASSQDIQSGRLKTCFKSQHLRSMLDITTAPSICRFADGNL